MNINNIWFIFNAFIITMFIILLWLIYAYNYKSSVHRMSKLAAKIFTPTLPIEIQSRYVVQCDPNLSSYDSATNMFKAVMTITPDMDNPNAPSQPNIVKLYRVINSPDNCENNIIACGETDQTNCLKPDAKTIVVAPATCININ